MPKRLPCKVTTYHPGGVIEVVTKVSYKGVYIPEDEVPKRVNKSQYNMTFFKEAFAYMGKDDVERHMQMMRCE